MLRLMNIASRRQPSRRKHATKSMPMYVKSCCNLSKLYLRLAEQADKNSRLDVTYEPPFPTASPAP